VAKSEGSAHLVIPVVVRPGSVSGGWWGVWPSLEMLTRPAWCPMCLLLFWFCL